MTFLKGLFPHHEAGARPTYEVLGNILRAMREAVIVVSADTRIIASNTAASGAFGRQKATLDGKRLSEVIRDLALHEAFRLALEEGRISDVELELIGTEKRKFDVRVAPVEVEGSRSAIGIFYEVTQIEKLERVRQEFLSNISHELRTPLASIMAFVETLEDGAINDHENNLRFLGVIRRNAERMHRLLDDIVELTSIESGRISIEPKSCRLAPAIDEIFTNLSVRSSDRGISLVNEVDAGCTVFADPIRLEQMLINLIENAVKFNRDGGSVTVTCRQERGMDVISVEDTGEGISGEHLKRIFERFYRTDRARSREIGGTGLGLAICKHLVRLHGGDISVKSVPGKGSVFSLELPNG